MITMIFTFVVTSIKSSCSSVSVADVSWADIWHLYAWILAWITIIIISIIYNVYQSLCFQTKSPFSLFVWSAPKMRVISQNAALSSSSPSGPWVIALISHQACDRFSSHCSVSLYCAKFSAFCFKMRVWLLVSASCVTKVWGFCVSCPFLGRFWDV